MQKLDANFLIKYNQNGHFRMNEKYWDICVHVTCNELGSVLYGSWMFGFELWVKSRNLEPALVGLMKQ